MDLIYIAVYEFLNNNNNFKVFYLNANKLLLCHKDYYNKYIHINVIYQMFG